jgi:hypothetical protein
MQPLANLDNASAKSVISVSLCHLSPKLGTAIPWAPQPNLGAQSNSAVLKHRHFLVRAISKSGAAVRTEWRGLVPRVSHRAELLSILSPCIRWV